jgi:tetratricopeptide (TPR) repeat protein
MRTALAHALHQAGKQSDAEILFREAEALLQKTAPGHQFLLSLSGFRFCDLLLSQGHFREVRERAGMTLQWAVSQGFVQDIGLDRLSLGRTALLQLQIENPPARSKQYRSVLQEAKDNLDLAVAGLREAGQQDDLPRGLLARAELHRVTSEYDCAQRDLDEAREIAERGEMKLHLADYHLEATRLSLAQEKPNDAREHLTAASQIVTETGYHRRDPEVTALESQLASV